jgi:hypothetical protein
LIHSTFRLAPGVGRHLEARLWEAGITRWSAFPEAPEVVLSPAVDGRIREGMARAEAALEAGDAEALAAMLPREERWRLYPTFAAQAAFLDVEMDGEAVTCVGILDRGGPRLLLAGRDLGLLPELARAWKLLVTFNGLSFDVPVLRRAFPAFRPPRAHVDLCRLWRRLGHAGGLKLLEEAEGISRPPHLRGVSGRDAGRLWRAHQEGSREALQLLAEYNLLDAVHLRTLMDKGYNRLVERLRLPAELVVVSEPGDVRYDVTRLVLSL